MKGIFKIIREDGLLPERPFILTNRLMNNKQNLFARFALVFAALILSASFAFAAEGDPIPGIDVKFVNADGMVVKTVKTDATGKFTCTLDEGVYGVCISNEACAAAVIKTKTKSNQSNDRTYSAGHFMLNLDGSSDIVVGDLDGDGKLDRVVSPRDIATGQASGKRMHKPFTITKEWSASSPGAKVSVYGKSKELTGHVTLIK
jgi:hypothetical protein